jgi:ubiquinone/menaquinone biosynthesis C-methylase UbiE
MRTHLLIAAMVTAAIVLAAQQPPRPQSRVFPPEELGRLAPPDRDEWQQPDKIMDALGIYDGNRVADVAAGGGWFTVRLARRVGPNGRVYSEDINPLMIESIRHATDREGLRNVETILGKTSDPRLPAGLQAALIVDSYFYLEDPIGVLRNTASALAPNGRLGIVDFKKDGAGGPGPELDRRTDPEVIVRAAAAAGLKLRSHETFLRYQYLLVFGK